MSNNRERRKWALEMSAALLESDMDTFGINENEFDEDEAEKRQAAVREIADELRRKAERMK